MANLILSIICCIIGIAAIVLTVTDRKLAMKQRNKTISIIADGDMELYNDLKAFCDERLNEGIEITTDEIDEIVQKHRKKHDQENQ